MYILSDDREQEGAGTDVYLEARPTGWGSEIQSPKLHLSVQLWQLSEKFVIKGPGPQEVFIAITSVALTVLEKSHSGSTYPGLVLEVSHIPLRNRRHCFHYNIHTTRPVTTKSLLSLLIILGVTFLGLVRAAYFEYMGCFLLSWLNSKKGLLLQVVMEMNRYYVSIATQGSCALEKLQYLKK